MAFTVEDGTNVAGANAYCDVAFVTAYLTETGDNTAWSALATDTLREQAIVKATRYIDQRFGPLFMSQRRHRTQSLQWPRVELLYDDGSVWIDENDIPNELKWATAEYANRASVDGATLIADPSSSRQPIETKEKVGPIEVVEKFEPGGGGGSTTVPAQAFSAYPTADLWLETLLKGQQGSLLQKA